MGCVSVPAGPADRVACNATLGGAARAAQHYRSMRNGTSALPGPGEGQSVGLKYTRAT